MKFEEYFAGAEFQSTGEFGISQTELLRKLDRFQVSHPDHGPLALIAAGLAAGARRIEVVIRRSMALYRFVGAREPDLEHGKGPAQKLLWAAAANQQGVRSLHLHCPVQGVALTRKGTGWKVEPERSGWLHRASRDCVQVELERSGRARDLEILTRSCSLCPVPIVLNGEPLQLPLTSCHPRVRWTASVPELFFPHGTGSLESDLALAWIDEGPSVAVVAGISYAFSLPAWIRGAAVVWHDSLRPDLGLSKIVQDSAWSSCQRELVRVARHLQAEA